MTALFLKETGNKEFAEVDASSMVLAAHDRGDDIKKPTSAPPAATPSQSEGTTAQTADVVVLAAPST